MNFDYKFKEYKIFVDGVLASFFFYKLEIDTSNVEFYVSICFIIWLNYSKFFRNDSLIDYFKKYNCGILYEA